MSRWRVSKDARYPRQWVAQNTGNHAEVERFPTHASALAYADYCARTREVTFQRQSFPMTVGKKQLVLTDPNTVAVIGKRGELVTGFHRKHWGQIAAALLALTAGDTA